MTISEIVKTWCEGENIRIHPQQLKQLEQYAAMLREWNQKMNLTAITDEEGIAVKHFIDSISVLKYLQLKKGDRLIDIGTGAGFPGIPLAIMEKELSLTLLDSLNKRLVFLEEVCRQLGLEAQLLHTRAEESGHDPNYRECYDVAVSRAVAALPALAEYCLPYVKIGGIFCSMKGSNGEEELTAAANGIRLLGGETEGVYHFTLPDDSERTLILIRKTKPTPEKYPRRGTKINKNPL